MARLDGKIAIITGGTSGIGRRTAEIFTSEGARVVTCGRRRQLGQALEEALGRDRCIFVEADVTKEADVQSVIERCVSEWGRVDCLFNNAGGPAPTGGIETIPVEGFDAAMATLVRSVMLGMKHAAPIMMK
jgi:NAD(P)-dependent dehydrogenase (short-subunit alcohol dehydrogenase family)